jgi:hypothetical protein
MTDGWWPFPLKVSTSSHRLRLDRALLNRALGAGPGGTETGPGNPGPLETGEGIKSGPDRRLRPEGVTFSATVY